MTRAKAIMAAALKTAAEVTKPKPVKTTRTGMNFKPLPNKKGVRVEITLLSGSGFILLNTKQLHDLVVALQRQLDGLEQ